MVKYKLYDNYDWLLEHYIVMKKSAHAIGREIGCSGTTIYRWLHDVGIPVRSRGEGIFLSKKNSVSISPLLLDFIVGGLLGDGCLRMNGNRSAAYQQSSKYKEYLVFISKQFADLGIEQSGRILKFENIGYGKVIYHYASKAYPELTKIRHKWYPDGKKIVPRDVVINPIVLRQWFIDDGNSTQYPYSKDIGLATCAFPEADVHFLVEQLSSLGLKATYRKSGNTIGISSYSVDDFLDFTGPCPIDCYSYKWNRHYEKTGGIKP